MFIFRYSYIFPFFKLILFFPTQINIEYLTLSTVYDIYIIHPTNLLQKGRVLPSVREMNIHLCFLFWGNERIQFCIRGK